MGRVQSTWCGVSFGVGVVVVEVRVDEARG